MLKFILSLFLSLLFSQSLFAQKDREEMDMPVIHKKDSTVIGEVNAKRIRFTPFLAPTVSPELGLMIVAGGLLSFKTDPGSEKLQPSSIPFSTGYSTNKSAMLNIRPSIFFKNDKNRMLGDIWMKNMPDNYWGIGFEAAENPSKPNATTSYQRYWWQINMKYVHQFRRYFFGGLQFEYNLTDATDLNPSMQQDPNVLEYGTFIRNLAPGLLFQYDSRDLTINAYEGVFLELSANFYFTKAISNSSFQTFVVDYRQYKQIKRPGSTLTWQVKTRVANDEVPWTEMSQVGSPFDLRGYFWGRYRDKNMAFGILEYRYMFKRKNPDKHGKMTSKFGLTTWTGTGSVANNYSEMTNWLPNLGFGFRFEVQNRMNARVDYGIGNDTSAIYVSFNEAF